LSPPGALVELAVPPPMPVVMESTLMRLADAMLAIDKIAAPAIKDRDADRAIV